MGPRNDTGWVRMGKFGPKTLCLQAFSMLMVDVGGGS